MSDGRTRRGMATGRFRGTVPGSEGVRVRPEPAPTELLAVCLCGAHYVTVPPSAVKSGAVYCAECAPAPALEGLRPVLVPYANANPQLLLEGGPARG